MPRVTLYARLLALAAALAAAAVPAPFTPEIGCTMQLTAHICTSSAVASQKRRFVLETVSFSGQATIGQAVGRTSPTNTAPDPARGHPNATTNAGQNTPYQQRLNLMGYLE